MTKYDMYVQNWTAASPMLIGVEFSGTILWKVVRLLMELANTVVG